MRRPGLRRTDPAPGRMAPRSTRSRVVLPDPDGPTIPMYRPGSTSRSTSMSTGSAPYAQVTCSSRTSGAMPRGFMARARSLRVHGRVGRDVAQRHALERRGVAAERLGHGDVVEAHEAEPRVLGVAG